MTIRLLHRASTLLLALLLAAPAASASAPVPDSESLPPWYQAALAERAAGLPGGGSPPVSVGPLSDVRDLRSASETALLYLAHDPFPDVSKARPLRLEVAARSGRSAIDALLWELPGAVTAEPAVPGEGDDLPTRLVGVHLETVALEEAFGYPAKLTDGTPFWDGRAALAGREHLEEGPLPEGARLTPISAERLLELALRAADDEARSVSSRSLLWRRDGIHGEVALALAYLSIAAAQHGLRERSLALLDQAFEAEPRLLVRLHEDRAWRHFNRALHALYHRGHAAAAPLLGAVAKRFPRSGFAAQAADLAAGCLEVASTAPVAGPADPAVSLVELKSLQMSDPGGPAILGFDRTWPTWKLAAAGPTLIPRLIELLADRRPTRSLYWHRRFFRGRHVVRVGDAALAVLEAIIGSGFYRRSCTGCSFLTEDAATRAKVLSAARSFWDSHKKGPAAFGWVKDRLVYACGKPIFRDPARACFTSGDSVEARAAVARWGVATLGAARMRPLLDKIARHGPDVHAAWAREILSELKGSR